MTDEPSEENQMRPKYLLMYQYGLLIGETACHPFDSIEEAEDELRQWRPPDEDHEYAILEWDDEAKCWCNPITYTESYWDDDDDPTHLLWPNPNKAEARI